MKKITNTLVVLQYIVIRLLACLFILSSSMQSGDGIIVFRWSLPAEFAIVAIYAICMFVLDVTSRNDVTSQFVIIIIIDVFAIYAVFKWSTVSLACIMMIFCLFELGFIKCREKEDKTASNDEIEDTKG